MFKLAKYYFLLNIYQKRKRNLIAIVISLLLLVVTSYLFSDLIIMAENKLGLVVAKWIILLFMLAVIVVNIRQIFTGIQYPFQTEKYDQPVDLKKEKILSKEKLVSRSDLILNKYRNKK